MVEETKQEELAEVLGGTEEDQNPNSQARRYMLTINNPPETDEWYIEYIEHLEHFQYASFQRERGHLTGTEHIQLFIIFTIGKRFSTIKNLFSNAHIESAKKSSVICRDYTTKSDTRVSGPYEIGVFREQGGRTDINNLMELVKSGASNEEILRLYPNHYLKYIDKIERIRQENLKKTLGGMFKQDFIVVYIYGVSGVGKTSSIFLHYGNKACYVRKYNKSDTFDEYDNEDVLVFDEFRGQIDFSEMLGLIDVYPLSLSRRYANKFGNYTKVFILTNQPPDTQYCFQKINDYRSWQGFERRIHFVLNFKSREKIVVEKASKSLFELEKVLPPNMIKILDTKNIASSMEEANKQVKFFEVTPDDELPF